MARTASTLVILRPLFAPLALGAFVACSSDDGNGGDATEMGVTGAGVPGATTNAGAGMPPAPGVTPGAQTPGQPPSGNTATPPAQPPQVSPPAQPATTQTTPPTASQPAPATPPATGPTQQQDAEPPVNPTPPATTAPMDPPLSMMGSGAMPNVELPDPGTGAMPNVEMPDPGAGGMPGSGGANAEGEVLFFDDFEGGSVGQAPPGWDTFVGWVANGDNPQGSTSALVSSERAVSMSQSVHFSGGQNPAQIAWALPQGTNKVYLTAWVYMTRQLGENPGDNHEHIFAIRGEPGSANNEVRFGEIKGVIGTNEVPSDNIAPLMDQWGMGPALPANTWICFEVGFLGDQAQHELHAWADGELVHSITAPDQWQNGAMPATWMDGKFVEAVFGWHSFSGNDIDVWMDDVIISTGRQGCR